MRRSRYSPAVEERISRLMGEVADVLNADLIRQKLEEGSRQEAMSRVWPYLSSFVQEFVNESLIEEQYAKEVQEAEQKKREGTWEWEEDRGWKTY